MSPLLFWVHMTLVIVLSMIAAPIALLCRLGQYRVSTEVPAHSEPCLWPNSQQSGNCWISFCTTNPTACRRSPPGSATSTRSLEKIMTIAEDIKAALAEVSATVTAEPDLLTAIGAKMDGLSAQITALEQQIADLQSNSGALSPADVTAVQESLAALKDATNANKAKEEILANTGTPPTP